MKTMLVLSACLMLCVAWAHAQQPTTPADVAAPPADATCTASGLCTKVLTAGTGTAHPDAWDEVTVHYSGWTTDGALFDSSVSRGEPATFPLNRVIPGWTEGVQLMVVGEQRRLWIPKQLAYNDRPGRPAGMLVFDVELLGITDRPEPPPPPAVPEDVAAPPADAPKTASGLASRVLRPGVGGEHPTATSTVTVHYSGWTTDGQLFDSRAHQLPAQPGHPGLDRGPAADGRRREAAALDSGGARLQGRCRRSPGHAGLRRRADLLQVSRQAPHPARPERRDRAARGGGRARRGGRARAEA
ncbi:MAG: FKBP-type peptidyl-prolyl cis-trans isomerase [Thermoanaerobaculales bacterium]|nr:FKBP-type peptidyl-prolyl cis-trans isomerase [Thermoanaerobaculales bacterium]